MLMEFVRATWENDKEYMSIVGDLLECKKLQKLDDITHHHYTTRLVHSLFVSYVSYKVAKSMNLDYVSTARAGLLHDFFLEEREEVVSLGLGSHNAAHPKIALKNAEKLTKLNKIEKDIILKHMFLCTFSLSFPRYQESFIVSMVDKYCAISEVSKPSRDWAKDLIERVQAKVTAMA